MMKFRFRRQGADPQREKLKQELFAFNKVRAGGPGRAGGRGPGLGARAPQPRRAAGRERPAGARGLGAPRRLPSRLRPCASPSARVSADFPVCLSGAAGRRPSSRGSASLRGSAPPSDSTASPRSAFARPEGGGPCLGPCVSAFLSVSLRLCLFLCILFLLPLHLCGVLEFSLCLLTPLGGSSAPLPALGQRRAGFVCFHTQVEREGWGEGADVGAVGLGNPFHVPLLPHPGLPTLPCSPCPARWGLQGCVPNRTSGRGPQFPLTWSHFSPCCGFLCHLGHAT